MQVLAQASLTGRCSGINGVSPGPAFSRAALAKYWGVLRASSIAGRRKGWDRAAQLQQAW